MFKRFFRSDQKTTGSSAPTPRRPAHHNDDATLSSLIGTALEHHRAGRFAEALEAYERALVVDSRNFDALHLSGVAAFQLGQHDIAAERIARALARDPSSAAAQNNLGVVLKALGRLEQALDCFRNALAMEPGYADARTNLFNAHFQLGNALRENYRLEEAARHFGEALAIDPDSAAARTNLGNALSDQGRVAEAIEQYERVIASDPSMPETRLNLAKACEAQRRLDEAVANYRKTTELRPEWHEAHYGLGNALKSMGRIEEAVSSYRQALSIKPDFADGHYALGNALKDRDDLSEMLDCYRNALQINPEYVEARWALAMCQLPAVYESEEQALSTRAAFTQELDGVYHWFDTHILADGARAVGSMQPFLLAYREENNRALLQKYGDLCARIMSAWFERERLPATKRDRKAGPARVGIVSQHFFNHSVWNAIIKGWFEHLDSNRVSLHAFYLGTVHDEETRFAQAHSAQFISGHQDLRNWVEAILRQNLDALIYPEIGMDPMTARLASLRLAPVQAASWGHPETTGLPTIDYYISAEYLEPSDGQSNYVERLVTLPGLGCYCRAVSVSAVEPVLHDLDLNSSTPLFICPGVPFKYAPEHDHVLAEIAQKVGRCRFVFFTHRLGNLSAKLRQRLKLAFARNHLDADRFIIFIPWQNSAGFHGWLRRADVFLDTIGFSGFNTAVQAAHCGVPIVTKEGRFMRGRLASGILNRIGLSELVAQSEEEYVALAVRLATDAGYRSRMRQQFQDNAPIIFEDNSPIRAFEDFLASVTAR